MIVYPKDNSCTEAIVGEQPRPKISAARVREIAEEKFNRPFKSEQARIRAAINQALREAGVEVKE